jgi:hypothetical protein
VTPFDVVFILHILPQVIKNHLLWHNPILLSRFYVEMKEISLRSFFILIHVTFLTASIALGLSPPLFDGTAAVSKTNFNRLRFA